MATCLVLPTHVRCPPPPPLQAQLKRGGGTIAGFCAPDGGKAFIRTEKKGPKVSAPTACGSGARGARTVSTLSGKATTRAPKAKSLKKSGAGTAAQPASIRGGKASGGSSGRTAGGAGGGSGGGGTATGTVPASSAGTAHKLGGSLASRSDSRSDREKRAAFFDAKFGGGK